MGSGSGSGLGLGVGVGVRLAGGKQVVVSKPVVQVRVGLLVPLDAALLVGLAGADAWLGLGLG